MSIKHEYGQSPKELAKKFRVSRQTIHAWHRAGRLTDAIRTGHRPEYDSKYRRKYGRTIEELTGLLGLSRQKISRLEAKGELGKLVDENTKP